MGDVSSEGDALRANAEKQLEPVLPALELAMTEGTTVIAMGVWQLLSYVALLPFHLHISWSGMLRPLPLNPCLAVCPPTDLALGAAPVYWPEEALETRRLARTARRNQLDRFPDDLHPADWERPLERHADELADRPLPGIAFVSIDTVRSSDGRLRRGQRPTLGRFARGALRPTVLVPGRGEPSSAAIDAFADSDLALFNLQGLRGHRALDWCDAILRRRAGKANVLFAAGPADLLALPLNLADAQAIRVHAIGHAPELATVRVSLVGSERVLQEKVFEYAARLPEGSSSEVIGIVALGKAAWWAIQQSVRENADAEPEVQAFFRAFERFRLRDASAAREVAYLRDILEQAATSSATRGPRRDAIVDATLRCGDGGNMVVLTRSWDSAQVVRHSIAVALGVTSEELAQLGVEVRSHRRADAVSGRTVILAGYFGRDCIDAVLQRRPSALHMILDPIEARAAWYGIYDLAQVLQKLGLPTQSVLKQIQDVLAREAPSFVPSSEVETMMSVQSGPDGLPRASLAEMAVPGTVVIVLEDGSVLTVTHNARFEVLGRLGSSLRLRKATDLQAGDEIVIVDEDVHAGFSASVIKLLDDGPLSELAERRLLWLSLVGSIVQQKRLTAGKIREALLAEGEVADAQSVRAWTAFSISSEASVPRSRSTFLSLARVLQLPLPAAELERTYQAIRMLRTLHRKAGRDLARAIRWAKGGRLGASSQAKLESTWGLTASRLLKAARAAVIDEVIVG